MGQWVNNYSRVGSDHGSMWQTRSCSFCTHFTVAFGEILRHLWICWILCTLCCLLLYSELVNNVVVLFTRLDSSGVQTLRTQDTSNLRQFGTISLVPKCLTFCVGAEVSLGHFGTSAEVSRTDRRRVHVLVSLHHLTSHLYRPSRSSDHALDPLTRCLLWYRHTLCVMFLHILR